MTAIRITGAPLVKTADQQRAERRAGRARWASYADTAVVVARGTFWTLAALAVFGADRMEAGARVLVELVR